LFFYLIFVKRFSSQKQILFSTYDEFIFSFVICYFELYFCSNFLILIDLHPQTIGEPMLSFVKEMFQSGNFTYNERIFSDEQKTQIAATTLFIEIAKADSDFSTGEHDKIIEILKKYFSLNSEQVEELIALANEWIKGSVSLYEFTDIINKHFTQDEKYELVKNLWGIVYVDNVLDKYEEHLIRIISNNLNLSHRDMIAAKLEAKQE
jgi:uncharacterized tellurite resistance protein B-like protein